MGRVSEFEHELNKRSKTNFGKWFKIDLHNHSPQSLDYKYKAADVEDKIVERISSSDLNVIFQSGRNELTHI